MKDIQCKKTKLGNTGIDGAVRETAFILKPYNKIPVVLPGGILRGTVLMFRKVLKISGYVSRIRNKGMVSETTQGEHLPKLL